MTLEEILARLDVFFWGPGTLLLVLGTGVFFLIRLRFLPWRNLGYALACALGRDARKASKPGALSPFASLMTALASWGWPPRSPRAGRVLWYGWS